MRNKLTVCADYLIRIFIASDFLVVFAILLLISISGISCFLGRESSIALVI